MDFLNLEKFLSNFSFFILFVSMIFYWIQLSFDFKTRLAGTLLISLSNLSLLFLLILRWKESGHFPLSNLYESLIFLSWNFTVLHLILEKTTVKGFQKFFGAITVPTALLTCVFASFSLPEDMQKSSALVPALQSNWLMMHVTVMILSYAALIGGCLLAISFLVLTYRFESPANIENSKILNDKNSLLVLETGNSNSISLSTEKKMENFSPNNKNQELAILLDNLSYRILGIGFPLLTIGILSGAVWANEAWGSYWSWDPKETWALLTWLVFAIYFHTRLTKGWQGKKPAIIASLGFFTLWVCFLGVNLLGEGLHSYGFFT